MSGSAPVSLVPLAAICCAVGFLVGTAAPSSLAVAPEAAASTAATTRAPLVTQPRRTLRSARLNAAGSATFPWTDDNKPASTTGLGCATTSAAATAAPLALLGLLATAAWRLSLRRPPPTPASNPLPQPETFRIEVAIMAVSGRKVALLGAAGGIGQPLALLLKECDDIKHLALYDLAPITRGVAVDLSHCDTPAYVSGHMGAEELGGALQGSEVVVITAGVPRKPGMTRDDLFNTNASIMKSLVEACATHCPQAILLIVANPVNSLVPIAAEVLQRAGVFDPRRVIGITTLDVVRANTWVAEATKTNPRSQNVVVVGGHAGTTIVPLLSKVKGAAFTEEETKALTKRIQFGGDEVVAAKDGGGSATLSMAYAGAIFVKRLLRAMNGEKGVVECCYTKNNLTEAEFFAAPTTLGPLGAEGVLPLGQLSVMEDIAIRAMLPDLRQQIRKGIEFARSS